MNRLVPRLGGLDSAGRRVGTILGCIVAPALLLALFFSVAFVTPEGSRINEPAFGWDFRAIWRAAGDVATGETPYAPPTRAALAGEDEFVYPPATAVVALPLRLVSFDVAAVLFGLLLVGAVFLTLRALDVRDWRCYGLVFTWVPVLESVRLGAISIALALGVALTWRWRDRIVLGAAAAAALIAAKLFLWPVVVWLAFTGRIRQAVAAVAGAAALTLGSWALIGFAGLREYPSMLNVLADLVGPKSYSLAALAGAVGAPSAVELALPLAVGAALLVAVVLVARRAGRAADVAALTLAVAAACALSPIVWTHYFALLIVPIALARPRLSPLWALPLVFWLSPNQSDGELWRIVVVGATAAVAFAVAAGVPFPRVARGRRDVVLAPAVHS